MEQGAKILKKSGVKSIYIGSGGGGGAVPLMHRVIEWQTDGAAFFFSLLGILMGFQD